MSIYPDDMPEALETALPHALDVERRVLSSLIQHREKLSLLRSIHFKPAHFYSSSHRKLFEIICQYHGEDRELDLVILTDLLRARNLLDDMGGVSEVTEIATCETLHSNLEAYARLIKDKALLRKAIEGTWKIKDLAHSEPDDVNDVITELESSLQELKLMSFSESKLSTGGEALHAFTDTLEANITGDPNALGTPIGLPLLDQYTGGMRAGRLVIPSAPTSGGKSVLSLQMVSAFLEAGKKALVFSLEMGREEVAQRILCHKGKISNDALSGARKPNKGEAQSLMKASKWLQSSNLLIDDSTTHIDEICAIAELEHERSPVSCVLVDYIQIAQGHRQKGDTREAEVSDIARKLKQLAKSLQCHVIAPSQLTDDGKLRESRAIGQHSDIVLSIEAKKIYLSKNRGGRRNVDTPYILNGELQSFELPTANYANYG